MFGRESICSTEPSTTRTGPRPGKAHPYTVSSLDAELPNALIKLMLFVGFLCMDASVAAWQRAVSHAARAGSHGHLLQGGSGRGVSSTGPAAGRI